HEAMRREGLLALRYDFVDVTINGKDLGLYALEEAFETRLVENNERKDGPIIRFNEDVLWGELARQESVAPKDRGFVAGSGGYFSSDIDAFQTSKWMETPAGRGQFLTAIQLLSSFRTGKVSVSDAFDLKKLATFFALSDLFSAWHGVGNWPNARFYYNPITSRLEPVAFDAYNRTTPPKPGLLALQAMDERRDPTSRRYISQFFADSAFYRQYVSELERVSSEAYVDAMQRDLAPKL
ncbi:MAG: CotH kinase family protein, partial [Rhodospirillaceae bacterium]|nr:CotH kinase family protein [Rhodospirillaceae bacterium]